MSSIPLHIHPLIETVQWKLPDNPINYSILYKTRTRDAARHFGFLPYFAKKPWPLVQEYIKYYTAPGGLVCDPFAGSGVTPVEALILGRRTVASDINPLARFLIRMTAIAPVNLSSLSKAYEQVKSGVEHLILTLDALPEADLDALLRTMDYPHDPIPSSVRRAGIRTVDQLHTPRQLAALTLLREAIDNIQDSVSHDLLLIAFANTIRYANRTYIGRGSETTGSQYRGNSGIFRRYSYSPASPNLFYELPVWPTFQRAVRSVLKAKEETNSLIGNRYSPRDFILAGVPASRIYEITGENSVDYFFTDPPYSKEIQFLDLSALWAAWLRIPISSKEQEDELIIGGSLKKRQSQYEAEFSASIESIARALKHDHWFTLVYKHKDLSLWQTIVAACEANGLRYVNSVWQDIKIKSTRQIENPAINPPGDMYVNFRKMPRNRFQRLYNKIPALELPTRPNYIEHEVERLIVSYLGAEIDLIESGVIQQVLNTAAFRDNRADALGLTEDIREVLKSPRFSRWQPTPGRELWVTAQNIIVDSSLPLVDRLRYHIFEILRENREITEGEVTKALLSYLAEERTDEITRETVRALLRHMAYEISPHRWRFDEGRVADYKQLRLLFWPSKADELRKRVNFQGLDRSPSFLSPNLEGLALLRDRLAASNESNKHFNVQWYRLLEVLNTVLGRLTGRYDDQIDHVRAIGDWTENGIDLQQLPFEEVLIMIVLRSSDLSFALQLQIAEDIFTDLGDDDIFIQFRLETKQEWQHAEEIARAGGYESSLGVPLLTRV